MSTNQSDEDTKLPPSDGNVAPPDDESVTGLLQEECDYYEREILQRFSGGKKT